MKRIKKADTKHMKMQEGWDYFIEKLNSKDYDTRWSVLYAIKPEACGDLWDDERNFMSELIYSLAVNINSDDAQFVFEQIGDKLEVGFTLVERMMRGIAMDRKNVTLSLQYGLNYLEIR
ncbi:MAG: hypothetical protein LBJ72_10715 [Dysgonamonadaceae bacterium]|jgi:hypothetical protein|nr:hypothetical protein [Dysgonamonadaceae bacterium]